MLKTYKARFAGMYDGRKYTNKIYQTDNEQEQKFIEDSPFFMIGEIKLISSIDNAIKPLTNQVISDIDYSGMKMPDIRKKARNLGIQVPNTAKKAEIIQMIENVS